MTLSEKVYAKLRHMIISERFRDDAVLSERSLAAQLDVSRVPVREAIQSLAREGLLTVRPRSGIQIRRLSLEEVREIYEVRQALEGMAAYLCSKRPVRKPMKTMRVELEKRASAKSVDHAKIQAMSSAFHRLMFELCDNSQLRSVYETVEPKIDLNLRLTAVHAPSRIEQAHEEHIAIARAIESGAAARAERLTRVHLENGKNARLKILSSLNHESFSCR
jgi:DNA-binding GntR family transcriptional regulator